jgi:hypothetical protein
LIRRFKSWSAVLLPLVVVAVFSGAENANARTIDGVDLSSSVPKSVVVDAATGRVVTAQVETGFGTLISNHNYCNSGDGCYHSGQVPYAHQGFYGTPGTFSGSWPYRSKWYTGRYTARACWVQACAERAFGPNTTVTFGGTLVTGTSFRIY